MDELIDYILDGFDFETVHKTMVALNWTWATCDQQVPSVANLRRSARSHLRFVADPKNEASCLASGGLMAFRMSNGTLHLVFEVAHSSEMDYIEEFPERALAGRAELAREEGE